MNEPLKALEELGEQFERAAFAAGPARRGGHRRRRVLVLAVIGVLLAATAAVAATGLLSGEPVRNPLGVTFEPDRGLGRPVPGRAALLDLRVADPAGGPPWGMRTVHTTRGLTCVQVGRVVDGRLGVLGRDGAFSDDGRFHPLPAGVLTQAYCQQPDGAGNAFLAVSYQGMPASALPQGCRASGAPGTPAVDGLPSPGAGPPTCPPADERNLVFGLLGPQATSVTYEDDAGREVTRPVSGPQGGYLVVRRPDEPPSGGFTPAASPGSGLESIQYRGAPTCTLRSPRAIGGAKRCPLVGYVKPRDPRVTAEQARSPVQATISRRAEVPDSGGGPVPGAPPARELTISFEAGLAGDGQSNYRVSVRPGRGERCPVELTGPIVRDVAPGETVRKTFSVPAGCRGTARGKVTFDAQGPPPGGLPFADTDGEDTLLVGRFEVDIPG